MRYYLRCSLVGPLKVEAPGLSSARELSNAHLTLIPTDLYTEQKLTCFSFFQRSIVVVIPRASHPYVSPALDYNQKINCLSEFFTFDSLLYVILGHLSRLFSYKDYLFLNGNLVSFSIACCPLRN